MSLLLKLILIVFIILIGFLFTFIWIKNRRLKILDSLRSKLFLVTLPARGKEDKSLEDELTLMEQFFSNIISFGKPVTLEASVSSLGEDIHFYISISRENSGSLLRQIHSIWDDAVVEEVGDYSIFNNDNETLGGHIMQAETSALPIRTYKETSSDTFKGILGALSKVNEIGEGASIQLVIKPALSSDKKNIKTILSSLKKGNKIGDFKGGFSSEDIKEAIYGKKEEKKEEKKEVDQDQIDLVKNKLSKPLVAVNLRIITSASSKEKTKEILDGLAAGFSQFESSSRNEFKVVKNRSIKNLSHNFSFREFSNKEKMILNTEELTSIFHFPLSANETSRVKSLKSRQVSPPSNLPQKGLLLGKSNFRGEESNIFITDEDKKRHLYLIGQTGTGKSNLLLNIINQDIQEGKGVSVLDPHGDLIDDILGLIPKERIDDVVVFDPSDLSHPLGINMLEYDLDRPEQKTFVVNEMVEIFDCLYDLKATGGPMFEQYMRNALLLLMEDFKNEPVTLMEVPRLFTDVDFRKRKLNRITNPTVIDFWEKEAEKAGGDAALSNVTSYITSKFNNFISNDYMRVIIGQTKSSFDFRKIMDEGKILLVDLSKGRIGQLNSNLLGMIIVGKILISAFSREDIAQQDRRDFSLYIDEFQNFTTDSIATILAEARKYGLSIIMAHQYIAQLEDSIKNAVFGNVGSKISFRVGAPDAEVLIKEFEPTLTTEDLVSIDNFHAYVKLLINGVTTKPFNIKTLRAPAPDLKRAQIIKDISLKKYGRSREEVERDILRRLRN